MSSNKADDKARLVPNGQGTDRDRSRRSLTPANQPQAIDLEEDDDDDEFSDESEGDNVKKQGPIASTLPAKRANPDAEDPNPHSPKKERIGGRYKRATGAADASTKAPEEVITQTNLCIRMDASQRNGEAIQKRISARQQTLLNAMTDILDAATEPLENQRDIMSIQSRKLNIEIQTAQIVRACEDLTHLVRQMQEIWLFGRLDTVGSGRTEEGMGEDVGKILEVLKGLDGDGVGKV